MAPRKREARLGQAGASADAKAKPLSKGSLTKGSTVGSSQTRALRKQPAAAPSRAPLSGTSRRSPASASKSSAESVHRVGEVQPTLRPACEQLPELLLVLPGHGLLARGGKVVPYAVRAVCALPSGESVVTSGEDGTTRVWDVETGKQVLQVHSHHPGVLSTTSFDDGRKVMTTGRDGCARIWDVSTGSILACLEGHDAPVTGGAVYPDGDQAITISHDGRARIWNVQTQQMVSPVVDLTFTAVSVSPDGQRTLAAREGGKVEVWCRSGQSMAELCSLGTRVVAIHVFPDSHRVLTVGKTGQAAIWEMASGQLLVRLPRVSSNLSCGAVAPSSSKVMTGDSVGNAYVMDAITGRLLVSWNVGSGKQVEHYEWSVHSCAFLPDGKRVLVAGDFGAQIWQLPGPALAADTVTIDPD